MWGWSKSELQKPNQKKKEKNKKTQRKEKKKKRKKAIPFSDRNIYRDELNITY